MPNAAGPAAAGEPGTDRIWRFAQIELDERSLELRVQGELSALEPKPLQVLFHLLRHAGEVVTKEELAEACWPRRILSESVLTKTVSRLREVLQDNDQAIIRTVHGYGYRLVAAVSVSSASRQGPAEPALAFKAGDRLGLRPSWVLTEQLGSGRSGEAWLARHERTAEQRVYKFPLDVMALGSLKREITLSRLLAEPASGRVARVLDWNLEQEPYFIEYEHAAGGNLLQWAEARGGLQRLPVALRIDLAAQIAEILAIAHSVGVLHKDLKPANVLVEPAADQNPRLKLSDFGSGGVLDPERLEALGITRLGFTRTLALTDAHSGTPLYLAPEVLAGQPATVQGDVYALGVMLYQLVVGDFRKPLAPGWELEIEDEVLREDIAATAAGDPRRRLGDAGVLAHRLRSLESRRLERRRQLQVQAQLEAEHHALERLRLRRKWMQSAIAALLLGAAVSLGLFMDARSARIEAMQAAQTSQAVADFLSADIFSAIGQMQKPPREWTVLELLNSASPEIERRFAERPLVAAPLHAAMGEAYLKLEEAAASEAHLQKALSLAGRGTDLPALKLRLESASHLVVFEYLGGRLAASLERYTPMLKEGEARLGLADPSVQGLRNSMSWGYATLGNWPMALDLLRQQIAVYAADPRADAVEYANAQRNLGNLLADAAKFEEAQAVLADAQQRLDAVADVSEFVRLPLRVAMLDLLIRRGQHAQAEAGMEQARQLIQRWAPTQASQYVDVLMLLESQLLIERGRQAQALPGLRVLNRRLAPNPGEKVDQRWATQELLGHAHQSLGQHPEAERQFRLALLSSQVSNGPDHPVTLRIHTGLADCLRERGQRAAAWAEFNQASAQALQMLPGEHPILAERLRVQGLLLAAEGRQDEARSALAESRRILRKKLGEGHGRSQRAAAELAAVGG